MAKFLAWWTESHRAYLYRVAGAVGVVAVAFGWITGTREGLYLGLVATVLSTGTAAANTSTKALTARMPGATRSLTFDITTADRQLLRGAVEHARSAPTVYVRRFTPADPRLGRHVHHDERSRLHPAATTAPGRVIWRHYGAVLDQGQLGSCTANALWQCLMTGPLYEPGQLRATEARARTLYHLETELQGGPVYPPADPGGSGLAVCKAGQQEGLIGSYTHAFGIDHARGAITVSPFIVGTAWYDDMFQPDATGRVRISGKLAGGHEYVIFGTEPDLDRWWCLTSWGRTFGVPMREAGLSGGAFWMDTATLTRLLNDRGDITVPVR